MSFLKRLLHLFDSIEEEEANDEPPPVGELGKQAWQRADDELQDTKRRQNRIERRANELKSRVEALERERVWRSRR